MGAASIIGEVIAALLVVMGAGYLLRRQGWLHDEGLTALARIVADVAFPALCLAGLARTDGRVLATAWAVPLLGFGTLALATLLAFPLARWLCPEASRPTFVFCVAVGNWIFLPLPVASALHHEEGTLVVLLHNVGAQVFLWTAGVGLLRGRGGASATWRVLARNAGLWATAAGVGIAVLAPSRSLPVGSLFGSVFRAASIAVEQLGGLTVPLAALTIGAQLASPTAARGTGVRPVAGVVVGRLLVAPAITIVLLGLVAPIVGLSAAALDTERLIALMPVSLTAAALVQRYGGDSVLAARAIALTTISSVVSVPFCHAWLSR